MPEDLVMDFSPNEELLFWNGKWYRLVKDSVKREEDGHLVRRVYREVDKGEYESRVKALAVKLVKVGDVKVEDIIYDAIKELPMDKVAEIEGALDEELKKDKPKVRGRKGCYNITIGKGRYRKGEFIPVR